MLAYMTAPTMTDGVSNIMDVVSTMLTTIKGDEILLTFFVAGLVGIAIGVVKRLKRG